MSSTRLKRKVVLIGKGIAALLLPIWALRAYIKIYRGYVLPRLNEANGCERLGKLKSCGPNCELRWPGVITGPDRAEFGEGVKIGTNAFIFANGGLKIGANTQISRNVVIYTANHNIAGKTVPYDDTYANKPVTIGESVWIGMNVCIIPGVTIGDGAIIGMGTTVTHDVPPGAIVVGQPARVVKFRDLEYFRKLHETGDWFSRQHTED